MTALDSLIINQLNLSGERLLPNDPGPTDYLLDVNGDFLASVLDAADVIDFLSGGAGHAPTAGRNPDDPWDVNNDGQADFTDYLVVAHALLFKWTWFAPPALDAVHIRDHGGNDAVSVSDLPAWIFGGAGYNTI